MQGGIECSIEQVGGATVGAAVASVLIMATVGLLFGYAGAYLYITACEISGM